LIAAQPFAGFGSRNQSASKSTDLRLPNLRTITLSYRQYQQQHAGNE
jgi:hypothetical protein